MTRIYSWEGDMSRQNERKWRTHTLKRTMYMLFITVHASHLLVCRKYVVQFHWMYDLHTVHYKEEERACYGGTWRVLLLLGRRSNSLEWFGRFPGKKPRLATGLFCEFFNMSLIFFKQKTTVLSHLLLWNYEVAGRFQKVVLVLD